MVTFEYTARDPRSGETVKAEVQADSVGSASKLLVAQGLFPLSIVDKNHAGGLGIISFGNRVRTRDLVIFTRQLSTLINAGLPLVQSLRNVENQLTNKTLKVATNDIIASVEGGTTLSESLSKHPKIFNQVYVYLVAAGETSGTLDEVLLRLADQQEKDAAILRKIRNAMIYPVIVLVVLVAVIIFLLVTLLPQVAALYKSLQRKLPPLTQALVGTSNFVIKFWYIVILVVVVGTVALISYIRTPDGRERLDRFKIDVPIFGILFRKVYMARFARTLATMLTSGIPMLEAMDVTKRAIKNVVVEDAIQRAANKVKAGKGLSTALEAEDSFIPLVPQMIAIGEQSGAIDDMLLKVATFYESDVDAAINNLSVTIEPVMMVILGVIVGLVIASVLLPIYGLATGNTASLGGG